MKNDFYYATHQAMHQLRVKQRYHSRMKGRAEARLRVAQERHLAEAARAEMAEAAGWVALLEIPGVTIPTAAALMAVSESTVSRWVARYNRGVEEERVSAPGGAS